MSSCFCSASVLQPPLGNKILLAIFVYSSRDYFCIWQEICVCSSPFFTQMLACFTCYNVPFFFFKFHVFLCLNSLVVLIPKTSNYKVKDMCLCSLIEITNMEILFSVKFVKVFSARSNVCECLFSYSLGKTVYY